MGMSANEYTEQFRLRHAAPKKPRRNINKEIKQARIGALNDAIDELRIAQRGAPIDWQRAYSSAITNLEILRDRTT